VIPPGDTSAHDVDPLLEQVRVAMAWNGGVSLAVWMGGVAVEIDNARRAPEAVQPATDDEPTRKVYAALSKALHRQLVVDILCGASAGGLNGSLLAAAMVSGRRIPVDLMRSKWIGIGDLSSLLQPIENSDPKSIMQGGSSPADPGIFYREVERFFAAIVDAGDADRDEAQQARTPTPIAPVDVLLDVMMTDVAGEPVSFRDVWGFDLAAREYRAPFRFRRPADYTVEALATAARSSASFPFAFEPFRVTADAAARAGFAGTRYAVDGGLLENAPIKPAIDAIPGRPATTSVRRYVCYVNAAPPTAEPADECPTEPTLREVAGYVINLPREARFVDQLYAIRDAGRRGVLASKLQPDLLRMPMSALTKTAEALLPTYRLRRLANALEEIVEDPARVTALMKEALAADPDAAAVPWLPADVDPPDTPAEWDWGIAAAERVLHLEIDIVRGLIPEADLDSRKFLLQRRSEIEEQLGLLLALRHEVLAELRAVVGASDEIDVLATMAGLDFSNRAEVYAALDAAWSSFHQVLSRVDELGRFNEFGPFVTDVLTDDSGAEPDDRTRFTKRALAIEVLRRAFVADADADTARRLAFAQLTPLAPTEIFRDAEGNVPDSGEKKLTGIRLGHFAAFYRNSWRANDFMWGRLDGATRIVDLLLGSPDGTGEPRVTELANLGCPVEWDQLAADLLAVGEAHAPARDSLLDELLPEGEGELADRLALTIAADMTTGDGSLTRRICACLAQLEILAEELPVLVDETAADMKLGCFTSPLQLQPRHDLLATIRTLRRGFAAEPPQWLPTLLGRDSADESTSDLALQTIAQTSIVGLASLRNLNVALGKLLAAARVPFVSITGLTARPRPAPAKESRLRRRLSRIPWERIGTIGSFFGATSYIALRIATASDPNPALGSLWSVPTLLYWVSGLAVLGVLVVPGVRFGKTPSIVRKLVQGSWLFALVATALLLPIALAWWKGHFPFAMFVGTAGAQSLPAALTGVALAVALGGVPLLKFLPGFVANQVAVRLKKLPVTVLLGAIGFALGAYASRYLGALSGWHLAVAVSAWVSVLVFIGYAIAGSKA
jgi:predicted acylesterase/phospholipase RssA